MSTISNPLGAFHFVVSIDGTPAAQFAECILPTVSIDVIEYRNGADVVNNVHKLPGLVKYGNLVLKRGIANAGNSMVLWDWISGWVQGIGVLHAVAVTLNDDKMNPVFRWEFTNAWPVRYESPTLSGKTSALAIETLEIAVDGVTFSTLGQST